MAHPSAVALLLSCLLVPASAMSGPSTKEVEVNGVRLPYVEQGSGEPIVFIHGAISNLRAWEPIRDEIARKYRFVAYTQRYFGIGAWKDDGKQFGVVNHASDLAKLITALNTGPVHLVGWSYGGAVATEAALKNPSLVRSLILYEPAVWEVLSADSPEEKEALEDRSKIFGPAVAANNAGDGGPSDPATARGGILPPTRRVRPGAAGSADDLARQFPDHPAVVRGFANRDHMRHTEEFQPADASPRRGEIVCNLEADQ
jgi:pimeloyl-ACP methyl ester carboxylesterase